MALKRNRNGIVLLKTKVVIFLLLTTRYLQYLRQLFLFVVRGTRRLICCRQFHRRLYPIILVFSKLKFTLNFRHLPYKCTTNSGYNHRCKYDNVFESGFRKISEIIVT